MSTRAQRRAARRLGIEPQGPVTPAVKAVNPGYVVPGQLAASVCLSIESREEFRALHQVFIDLHAPTSAGEHLIVEEMVVARWRLQRTWVMQTALLENEMDEMTDQVARDFETMNESTRLTLAFKNLAENGPGLPTLDRYETRLSRQLQRCQKQLADLRASKATNLKKEKELSNGPSEPNPTNEHLRKAVQHPAPAAPPAGSQTSAEAECHRPPVRPAVPAPALDVFPGSAQRGHREASPELPPALPRAA